MSHQQLSLPTYIIVVKVRTDGFYTALGGFSRYYGEDEALGFAGKLFDYYQFMYPQETFSIIRRDEMTEVIKVCPDDLL